MRLQAWQWRKTIGVLAIVAGIAVAMAGFMAAAQTPQTDQSYAAALIGSKVFSAEGFEVGAVSAVSIGADGQISEIRFTTSALMGLGERTVVVQQGSFIALEGAIVLELSAEEVDALPVQTVRRGSLV
jgi:hypothetical protein